ncbi:hypothetical protein NDU88_011056 [Pleurodeles waltl]|uniref:Fucolectin tachylectin-4 pentraxin-1 domain-containing protein n=1 Tax=Pleurodeles waltl TaxID=8319 RepID=A0AAV7S3M0_PLEWA|nr:hypothetical protein NDU88_011056 [Pleurodeles waltl]
MQGGRLRMLAWTLRSVAIGWKGIQKATGAKTDNVRFKKPQEPDTSKHRMKVILQAALTCMMLVISASDYSDRNVALRGRVTQSSVLTGQWQSVGYLGLAINAVDGNLDPNYYHGSCSHTHIEKSPWWRLDMLDQYHIDTVKITNRNEFAERLTGAEIRIGNSLANNGNNNPRCTVITNIGASATGTFQCHGMKGRYLNIIVPGITAFLTLCEVQVFGDLVYDHAG